MSFWGANGKELTVSKRPCLQASVAKIGQLRPIRTSFQTTVETWYCFFSAFCNDGAESEDPSPQLL
jgi:hypothetical protein